MTANDFNRLLESRICKIRDVLAAKANEYASDDRLHNFKANIGGVDTNEIPALVAWGYLRKHLQSIYDIASGAKAATQSVIDEKIGDGINYLILLEAILTESILERENTKQEHHGAD